MSTSDDQPTDETAADEAAGASNPAETTTPAEARAGDQPVKVADELPAPAVDEAPAAGGVPVADEKPAGETATPEPAAPSAGPAAPPPPPAGPATPPPGTTAPMRPVSTPAPADLEAAARHAAVRPTPVPPDPAPPARISTVPDRAPGSTGAGAAAVGAAGIAAAGASGLGSAGAGAAASTTAGPPTAVMSAPVTSVPVTSAPAIPPGIGAATVPSSDLFPDPNAPRTITVGTHVLGVLVGILLPLAATIVAALGISRILAVEVDGWVAKVDVLGIVLVTLGALLLLACVLLSLWTPSVGLVGGGILTLAGGFALYAPGVARTAVLDVLSSEAWKPTVEQAVVVATSGTVVVIGVMLLGGGIVSSVARRHGIRLGAFRERHRNP